MELNNYIFPEGNIHSYEYTEGIKFPFRAYFSFFSLGLSESIRKARIGYRDSSKRLYAKILFSGRIIDGVLS